MQEMIVNTLFLLETLVFLTVIIFQLMSESKATVILYAAQSFIVSTMLIVFSYQENSSGLFISALAMLAVKVLIMPIFFFKIINKQKLKFSTTSYLSIPMTLLVIMLIVVLANSSIFISLSAISGDFGGAMPIAMSAILASLFLTINKRGAISQIIGILSLENSIVSLASIIGLKQTLILELGIIFDIFVWIIIATVFVSMMHKHFGSLDISQVRHLKD